MPSPTCTNVYTHIYSCTRSRVRTHTHRHTLFFKQYSLKKCRCFFWKTFFTEIATRLIPIHSTLYSWGTVWICTLLLKLGLFQVWTSTLLPLFFSSPPSFLFGVGIEPRAYYRPSLHCATDYTCSSLSIISGSSEGKWNYTFHSGL